MRVKKSDHGCTLKNYEKECEIITEEEIDFIFPKNEFNKELYNFWRSMVDGEEIE